MIMLTAEQLEQRRAGIGGSDASAALGLNPFKTPLDLYHDKLGLRDDEISNPDAVHFGNVLEDVVAAEYAERTGNKVRRVNSVQTHKDHAFMLANLDRRVVGQHKVLECKTANQYTTNKWGDSSTDQVPEHYLLQVTHYMAVMGWSEADLAVLIGGQDFRIYNFERDDELVDMLTEAERKFWQRVQNHEPPAAINSHDIDTYMAMDNGESIVASDEVEQVVTLLRDVKARLKELTTTKTQLETQAKIFMSESSVLLGADGSPIVTFKKAKDSSRFDTKTFKENEAEIYEQYRTITKGSRRFLVK